MKNVMNITANLDEPVFLKSIIERLASKHVDMGYTQAVVPAQWKAIESSCVQADVNGCIDMRADNKENNIPFTGSFLFTCIKEINRPFMLQWCASLS